MPLTPILLSFFLYSYATLPHLHFFPTRRSSDLDALKLPSVSSSSTRMVAERLSTASLERSSARRRRADPPVRSTDRKSTRLNSSHTVISYAVFCLKKKKK